MLQLSRINGVLMRLLSRVLLVFCLCFASHAGAQDSGAVRSSIQNLLTNGQRLALPLERIKPALIAHYVNNGGSVYWVGTGRIIMLEPRRLATRAAARHMAGLLGEPRVNVLALNLALDQAASK